MLFMNKLFTASTRGGKYAIEVIPSDENPHCWIWRESINGRFTGSGGSVRHDYVVRRVAGIIKNSAAIDGINYRIELDTVGVQAELNVPEVKERRLYPSARANACYQ